ncbi:unnamed protein product [Protopolystoma xenopodis]|uniref:Uncharacterized protein n=1 Tax=Protopolystoma xenopodis TaxID=117903 RepID=A0A448WCK6_9PLAT|nr:unnamed protein product [Protopolystoma xenopodis]
MSFWLLSLIVSLVSPDSAFYKVSSASARRLITADPREAKLGLGSANRLVIPIRVYVWLALGQKVQNKKSLKARCEQMGNLISHTLLITIASADVGRQVDASKGNCINLEIRFDLVLAIWPCLHKDFEAGALAMHSKSHMISHHDHS